MSKLFHAATKTDPIYPLLDDRHVKAMERRLDKILQGLFLNYFKIIAPDQPFYVEPHLVRYSSALPDKLN